MSALLRFLRWNPGDAAGRRPRKRLRSVVFAILSIVFLARGAASAQELTRNDGLFISVPNPITSEAVAQIKQKVQDAVDGPKKRNITTVVFDFNPTGQPSSTSDFGSCTSSPSQLHPGSMSRT